MGLTIALDILPVDLELLHRLMDKHLPGVEVWAYGSRVQGNAGTYSDLDLAVFLPAARWAEMGGLKEALEESNLPFRVDLHLWEELPAWLKERIRRRHQVLRTC